MSSISSLDEGYHGAVPIIKQWDPTEDFRKSRQEEDFYSSMIVVGKRESGKSLFLRDLYMKYWRNLYKMIVIFSADAGTSYKYMVDNTNRRIMRLLEYNEKVVQTLLKSNKQLIAQGKPIVPILIIFDDCMTDKMKNVEAINQLFIRGRHAKISIVIAIQKLTLLRTSWRSNSDVIVLFREGSRKIMDNIIDEFIATRGDERLIDQSGYHSERTFFRDLWSYYTQEYAALIIRSRGINFADSIQWYRAELPRR